MSIRDQRINSEIHVWCVGCLEVIWIRIRSIRGLNITCVKNIMCIPMSSISAICVQRTPLNIQALRASFLKNSIKEIYLGFLLTLNDVRS